MMIEQYNKGMGGVGLDLFDQFRGKYRSTLRNEFGITLYLGLFGMYPLYMDGFVIARSMKRSHNLIS